MVRKKAVGTDYIPENYAENYTNKKQTHKVRTSRKSHWVLRVTPGVAVIALIFIICFSLVIQNVWINFLGFQTSELKKEILDIQESIEKLKLEIAAQGSLDRIENIAINKLGMVYPKSVHYIFPNDLNREEQTSVQIAGFNPPVSKNISKESDMKIPRKAWLGTIQDFFFNWLKGEESRS